jgi:MinD-like ATPase involved in chromosome partitioning or flagellar assembly
LVLGRETVDILVTKKDRFEPEAVLESFAERVTPSSWSGSRANVMKPRANAISGLVEHERPEISQALKSVSAKLVKLTEYEREREQREDEEREQRFE